MDHCVITIRMESFWFQFSLKKLLFFNNFCSKRVRITLLSFSKWVLNVLSLDVKKVEKLQEKKLDKLFDQVYKNVSYLVRKRIKSCFRKSKKNKSKCEKTASV